MRKKGFFMKLVIKTICFLMAIMFLPVISFADANSWKIRPFVGYEVSALRASKLDYSQDYTPGHYKDLRIFNRLYDGNLVLGAEFFNYIAVSVKPDFAQSEETSLYRDKEMHKKNEVYLDFDIFLAKRRSNFKPYISFNVGYMDLQMVTYLSEFGDILMYAGVNKNYSFWALGFGAGCKYYIKKNVYLMTDVEYKRTTEDFPFRLTTTNWNIGVGYRF